MSIAEQLRRLEQQLMSRLKELEPLNREHDQLRKLAERLGISHSPTSSAEGPTAPSPPAGASGAGSPSRPATRRAGARTKPRATRAMRPRSAKAATGAPATAPTAADTTTATPPSAPSGATSKTRRAGKLARRTGRGATTARPGERERDVLRLVEENAGITVREIATRLGVEATGLYGIVRRLTGDGRVRKDGTRLYAAAPATAASPVAEPPAAPSDSEPGPDQPTAAAATPAPAEPETSTPPATKSA